MRRFPLIALILFLAIGASATANTVSARRVSPQRLHRHTHPGTHPGTQPGSGTAHKRPSATSASKLANGAKPLRTASKQTAEPRPAASHPLARVSHTASPRSKATHRHARMQTASMSRRFPASRRRASLRTVSFRWASPLAGSRESLIHQNEMAEAEGLERIQDDADLDNRIAQGALVPVPVNDALHINEDLPDNRRYCRPWTADFLRSLAEAHATEFPRSALEVTSAVRTVEYQRRLRRINGNAAAADGDIASPHLTGGTIDLAKKGMSRREIAWMRTWLMPLQQAGKIDVEEEFRQACFHISVYKTFDADMPDAPASTVADGLLDSPGR